MPVSLRKVPSGYNEISVSTEDGGNAIYLSNEELNELKKILFEEEFLKCDHED